MQEYQTLIIKDELKYPEQYHDQVVKYTQTKRSVDDIGLNRQENPFQRYVDLWFLAVCLGSNQKLDNEESLIEMHKFHDGSILTRDSWRIDMLAVMAIGYTGDHTIIERPKAVVDLANSLTVLGMPLLMNMIEDELDIPDFSAPIWKLSRRLNILLSELKCGPNIQE